MDAYVYRAALWCGPCILELLFDKDLVDPHEKDPAAALRSAMKAHGYENESDYDSDDLPKGPYPNGGGEADTPHHCDGCGVFLENSLTPDGTRTVIKQLVEHARDGDGSAETLKTWGDFYNFSVFEPGEVTIGDLRNEYALVFDGPEDCREWWFKAAGELYARGEALPDEWEYRSGLHPVDPDGTEAPLVAAASTETLWRFAEELADGCQKHKDEGAFEEE